MRAMVLSYNSPPIILQVVWELRVPAPPLCIHLDLQSALAKAESIPLSGFDRTNTARCACFDPELYRLGLAVPSRSCVYVGKTT
jgi:hypothetical protein